MSDPGVSPRLTPRLAAEIRAGKQRRARLRRRIAVVGMACRFPGGANPSAFWEQLAAGGDAVTKGRPGVLDVDAATREAASFGAYLKEIDRFDAGFFRIAPVEAELVDPQQRLLLETSWEALEDAGLDPAGLRGSRTGVYAGITVADYRDLVGGPDGDPARSLYVSTGGSPAAAVGRGWRSRSGSRARRSRWTPRVPRRWWRSTRRRPRSRAARRTWRLQAESTRFSPAD